MKRLAICLALLLLSTISASAASRFLVACTTTCTWDGSNTAIWSATTGGAGGQSVPGVADTVTLDANSCTGGLTCTIIVNTTVTVLSIAMGTCTGTTTGCILDFSINNNNVTLSDMAGLSSNGTGTRTLKMGSGTWTFVYTTGIAGSIINFNPATNFTLTAGSSTIKVTGNTSVNRVITTVAGLTFNNLLIDANNVGGAVVFSQNAITFNNITLVGPTQLFLPQSNTVTATSLTTTSSANRVVYLSTNLSSAKATVSVASGTQALSWIGISGVIFTGGATFTATNSFNLGPNTGITITGPSAGFGSGSACILGGWLLWRDFDPSRLNDNFPAFLEKAS